MAQEYERTNEQLKEMQGWSFAKKVQVAQTRIIEFYQRTEGMCYISFSGGKDSTVLLDIARKIYPDIEAVYCDTGLEYPEVRNHVKAIPNVTWLRPEMNFRKVVTDVGYPIMSKEYARRLEEYWMRIDNGTLEKDSWVYEWAFQMGKDAHGNPSRYNITNHWKEIMIDQRPPFKVSSKCCGIMKKAPMHKFERQTGKHPITGTMAEESLVRTQAWLTTGCNSFKDGNIMSKPLSIWTNQDIYEYLIRYNLSIPSVYGEIIRDENGKYKTTGADRTGCMFCGFGAHLDAKPNRFQRMRVSHPKQWAYCMKPTSEGGLGMKAVLDYCDIPTGYDDQYQLSLLEDNDFIYIAD